MEGRIIISNEEEKEDVAELLSKANREVHAAQKELFIANQEMLALRTNMFLAKEDLEQHQAEIKVLQLTSSAFSSLIQYLNDGNAYDDANSKIKTSIATVPTLFRDQNEKYRKLINEIDRYLDLIVNLNASLTLAILLRDGKQSSAIKVQLDEIKNEIYQKQATLEEENAIAQLMLPDMMSRCENMSKLARKKRDDAAANLENKKASQDYYFIQVGISCGINSKKEKKQEGESQPQPQLGEKRRRPSAEQDFSDDGSGAKKAKNETLYFAAPVSVSKLSFATFRRPPPAGEQGGRRSPFPKHLKRPGMSASSIEG